MTMKPDNRVDIKDPTIDQCQRGWMLSTYSDSGAFLIEGVVDGVVSALCYIGGTKECVKDIDVKDIKWTWSVGETYDQVLETVGAFNVAIENVLEERKRIGL